MPAAKVTLPGPGPPGSLRRSAPRPPGSALPCAEGGAAGRPARAHSAARPPPTYARPGAAGGNGPHRALPHQAQPRHGARRTAALPSPESLAGCSRSSPGPPPPPCPPRPYPAWRRSPPDTGPTSCPALPPTPSWPSPRLLPPPRNSREICRRGQAAVR